MNADAEGRGDDRNLFRSLKSLPNAPTGEPSVTSAVNLARLHPFKLAMFREYGVRLEQYMTVTPALDAEIARAVEAQRAQVAHARATIDVGDVQFALPPRGGGPQSP